MARGQFKVKFISNNSPYKSAQAHYKIPFDYNNDNNQNYKFTYNSTPSIAGCIVDTEYIDLDITSTGTCK